MALNFRPQKKHAAVGLIAVSLAIPTAVINHTYPRLTAAEGLALVSYYDPWGHVWTGCIGETKNVKPNQHFTKQQCFDDLANRLPDFWVPMVHASPVLGTDLVPVSFKSSFLRFSWNEGSGMFVRYIAPQLNAIVNKNGWTLADLKPVCEHMMSFTRAGNNPTLLKPRRIKEVADCELEL
jgi:lysozyme